VFRLQGAVDILDWVPLQQRSGGDPCLDRAMLQVTSVKRGDQFGTETQAFYGHRPGEGTLRVDAALLGNGVEVDYSGDLATVHFKNLKQGERALKLENPTVRNAANTELSVEVAQKVVQLPTTYGLAQNYPNLFNPGTTLKYHVPLPSAVEIAVYNVLARRL
jgi:hypothetical protein